MGEAMITSGCFANGAATVASSRGGRPMITRSISFAASNLMTSSRLPTENRIVTSGYAGANADRSDGAKYFAVLTAPSFNTPRFRPRMAASVSPASRSRSVTCVAHRNSSCPAAVT